MKQIFFLLFFYSTVSAAQVDTMQLLFIDKAVTEKWLADNHIPALGIGYIKEAKIVETAVYGDTKYADNTIFNVASLTKPVTAMVTLKLVDAGKWNLDELLYKYYTHPDIAPDPRSKLLTTRHILSHTSGFPNWAGDTLAFQYDPGTKYQYSGEGFEYLRRALEAKLGKTLDQLATELIFQPLGMKDTRFFWDSTVDETRFAAWYKADGSKYATYKNTTPNAADDLLTTVADYTKFMQYIMNGAGLSKKLYNEMVSQQSVVGPRKYYGLGWMMYDNVDNGQEAISHGGKDKGVNTIAIILPHLKQALLIFTNCDNGTDVYIPAVQHYLGKAGQAIIDIETK
jgi:Beta-lactamase class C and other penicillin binding proteins